MLFDLNWGLGQSKTGVHLGPERSQPWVAQLTVRYVADDYSPLTVVVSLTTGAAATVGRAEVGRARSGLALVADPLEGATGETTVAVAGRLGIGRVLAERAVSEDLTVSGG